ncbi:glycosyltransferase family 91 protein [Babjeviella inositovora NRRL Y-12698]|uniref:Glycosyltransferase family 91 protein n=1 Tax=Babjeviella inositovora NRRL Y-12698 TaxID=984486 RepID=A0A1E3QUA9_9ASCO|nr:glycosyltransferase family 91 protein [Babjeviella inositovora NRRL Y-12698]ODQ81271.1 glycosyltransferase family 91 protein [Babjeviella inositovora NRRL Y-12698]
MARKSIYRDHISFPDDELEGDHVSHHWFYFSGDSVWLQDYGVHFHVTRVFFSRDGIRSHPKFSVLYAQLYDADWREVKGMLQLQTSAPVKPKETFFLGLFRSFLPSQLYRRENEFLDGPLTSSTNMKFPQILPIPFRQNSESFLGPEDPRITLRKNPLGFEEPMIVFNMKSYELGNKRCLHTYFPFTETLTPLLIQGYPPLGNQKNWVPFFDPTEAVNTHAQFLYNLNPLEVLNCDLATGACRFIQGSAAGNSVLKLNDLKLSKMRGGSTLWPIPDALQTKLSTGKRLWVGFARAHLVNCGCGDSMYRPNLFVLQQNTFTGEYEVLANSEFLDFDVEITPWKNPPGEDPVCEGVNVLIPNGISYWYVRETKKPKKSPFGLFGGIASLGEPKATSTAKDSLKSRSSGSVAETFSEGPNPGSFDDYMGLTISSGDANVQIVHIRGLLNHIALLPGLFDDVDSGSFQDIESLASGKTPLFTERRWSNAVGCALQYSSFYCMKLGAANDKVLEMKKTKEYQEKAKAEAEAKAKVDAERIKEETRIKEIEEEERKVKQALEMDEKKKEEHRKAMHQGENK